MDMNKSVIYVLLVIILIATTGLVSSWFTKLEIREKKQITANELSFSAYNNIQNAINMTVQFHEHNKTGQNYMYRIKYILIPAIGNLRSAEKLYDEVGIEHEGLTNTISSLVKLREYVSENWGYKGKILSVLKNNDIDPIFISISSDSDLSGISAFSTNFNGNVADYSHEIEEALKDGN